MKLFELKLWIKLKLIFEWNCVVVWYKSVLFVYLIKVEFWGWEKNGFVIDVDIYWFKIKLLGKKGF